MSTPEPTTSETPPPPNYGGLYGGLAVMALALTGAQMFADIVEENRRVTYLSLWEMLGTPYGGELALMSLTMVFLVVTVCGVAVVRGVRTVAIPTVLVVFGIIAALMLINRVGAGNHEDLELATAGAMMLVTCWGAVALGIINGIHVSVWRKRVREQERTRQVSSQ